MRVYGGVNSLSELRSQGQQYYAINWAAPNSLQVGDSGQYVQFLQYMLSVLSEYIPSIPPLSVDGIFGQATRAAVLAAQRRFGLPETGSVDVNTWDAIYDQYSGIENTTLRSQTNFPASSGGSVQAGNIRAVGNFNRNGNQNNNVPSTNRSNYSRTSTMTQFPGRDLSIGSQDPVRKEVVR